MATTGTDGDWVVKVIDVYPGDAPDPKPNPQNVRMGGFQMLLAGDILRAKFRNSMSDARADGAEPADDSCSSRSATSTTRS